MPVQRADGVFECRERHHLRPRVYAHHSPDMIRALGIWIRRCVQAGEQGTNSRFVDTDGFEEWRTVSRGWHEELGKCQLHGAFAEAPGSQVPVGGMPGLQPGRRSSRSRAQCTAERAAQRTSARRPLANEREAHQGGGVAAIAWWNGVR